MPDSIPKEESLKRLNGCSDLFCTFSRNKYIVKTFQIPYIDYWFMFLFLTTAIDLKILNFSIRYTAYLVLYNHYFMHAF